MRIQCTRQRCQVEPNTRRIAAFSPSWASEITSLIPRKPRRAMLFRKLDQKVSASEGPICSPTISRRPSVLTATAIIAATETMRPPSRCFRYVAPSHRYGHSPANGRSRKAWTRSSISLQSLETCDLLIPDSPIACTRSSTRRVETPPIQASWRTAISAFSELLRAWRNGGKEAPLRQFRDAQLQGAEPGVECAVAVTVAPGGPLAVALVTPGADQPLDIGLHQQLQHRLCHGSQKISLTSLLQQLGQYQSLFGHRVLLRFRLKSRNSTLAVRPDGHLNYAANLRCGRFRNSTTCVDANRLPELSRRMGRKASGGRI